MMTDEERKGFMSDDMATWLDELSSERRAILTIRMGRKIRDAVGEWTDGTDPVLVETTFMEVAERMFIQDMLDEMVEDGDIFISGIDDEGNWTYTAIESEGTLGNK